MSTPLQELDSLRAQIDAHRPFTPNLVETLQNHLLPRYLYCSSALGKRTHLSEIELTAFYEREIVSGGHPLDRFLAVQRHQDAYAFVETCAREGRPIDLAFTREIHHRLTSGSRAATVRAGQWRDHEHPPAERGGKTFVYSAPDQIQQHMKDALTGFNQQLEQSTVPAAVAWFYYQFHLIHPFGSENGAVARLVATAALMHHGFPPLVIEPEQVGALLEALAACAPEQERVHALEECRHAPLAQFVGRCLVRTATELLDLLEGRAIASSKDLAQQVPQDQRRVLEHVLKSPSVSWRVRGGFEVRTLHERLRRLAQQAACVGPLYELSLEANEVGNRHRFAGTRIGTKLPAADAGIVGDMTLEIRGNPDTGLRMPPAFRLQLAVAGAQHGLHILVHWQDEEKVTEHHGPPRAVEWPDKDLDRLLVQELDERRRRFELLLLDENLSPQAQTRIRDALELRADQAPRRRTGSFSRKFLVDRAPPELPEAQPVSGGRPSGQHTLRLDARGCPSCQQHVKPGEGLTCPDCETVYHEACLARLPGCLTQACLAKRKTARTPRKISGKTRNAALDGLRPSEPPLSF